MNFNKKRKIGFFGLETLTSFGQHGQIARYAVGWAFVVHVVVVVVLILTTWASQNSFYLSIHTLTYITVICTRKYKIEDEIKTKNLNANLHNLITQRLEK